MAEIRVAIVGIGNCASSLLQGLEYYKSIDGNSSPVPGLMHNIIGGYLVRDIKVVAAFDVNANKVGKDISDAIWEAPNNARKFADVSRKGVVVLPGPRLDGIAKHIGGYFPTIDEADNVVNVLRDSGAEILVSYLPVGSKEATRFYASTCLETRVAFINGIPEFIASDSEWVKKFEEAKIPCAGDDILSQVGATIIHRTLVELITERGQTTDYTHQLSACGNMDSLNQTDSIRQESKKESIKTPLDVGVGKIEIASTYLPSLKNKQQSYIHIEGRQFGGIPFEIELRISIDASPNNAGVMVDAIRLMKLSLDRKLAGYQPWSVYYFKHPLHHVPLREAKQVVEDFIQGRK